MNNVNSWDAVHRTRQTPTNKAEVSGAYPRHHCQPNLDLRIARKLVTEVVYSNAVSNEPHAYLELASVAVLMYGNVLFLVARGLCVQPGEASFMRPRRLSMAEGSELEKSLAQELLGMGRGTGLLMGEEEAEREVRSNSGRAHNLP